VRLLGWTALLLDDPPPGGENQGEPAIVSPPGEKSDVVRLPLPDAGESAGGKA
jgi:hypothetical protein